jgi:hypothetical protein
VARVKLLFPFARQLIRMHGLCADLSAYWHGDCLQVVIIFLRTIVENVLKDAYSLFLLSDALFMGKSMQWGGDATVSIKSIGPL